MTTRIKHGVGYRDGSSGDIRYSCRAEAEQERREVLLRRQQGKSSGDTKVGRACARCIQDQRFRHEIDPLVGERERERDAFVRKWLRTEREFFIFARKRWMSMG